MEPTLRTRVDGDSVHITDASYSWYWGTGPLLPYDSQTRHEAITDTVGRARVRPCDHYKWELVGEPRFFHDCVTEGLPQMAFNVRIPTLDMHVNNLLLLPDESSLQLPMLRAFNSFSTVFPSDFAPIEFVEGLKDWRKLIPSVSGDAPKDIASFYLGQKWGRDQLVADIGYFTSLLSTCKARLDWLRRTYGKPTPLYYAERLEAPSFEPFRVEFSYGNSWGITYRLVASELKFSARATLLHRIPNLDNAKSLYQAIASALGVSNPLKAIWQSTRMSFVFDWFFNVSLLLDRLAQIRPAGEWSLYDVTHSVKLEAILGVEQDNHYSGLTSENVPLNDLRMTRYRRSLGLPLDMAGLLQSSLSPNQQLALMAMATSKAIH